MVPGLDRGTLLSLVGGSTRAASVVTLWLKLSADVSSAQAAIGNNATIVKRMLKRLIGMTPSNRTDGDAAQWKEQEPMARRPLGSLLPG